MIRQFNGGHSIEDEHVLQEAAAILANGGLVAFPTETVYGLGANALDPAAVARIFKAKGRPSDNPLIVHIAQISALDALVKDVPAVGKALAEAFWPGPLTMIFHKKGVVPNETSGGLPTVAVRFPANKTALRFIKAAGFPIAAPSANTSGKPSPTKASHVAHDLSGKIDMLIDGGACDLGLESTIVDVTVDPPRILRPGSVTREMLEAVVGKLDVDPSVLLENAAAEPKAPGMKYTHYAPLADVLIVDGALTAVVHRIKELALHTPRKAGVMATDQTFSAYDHDKYLVLSVGDRQKPETIAANLFNTLRQFDFHGVDEVYTEGFPEDGLGFAIMNRLKKAAGYHILHLA